MINIAGGLISVALGILSFINWPWRVLEVFQGLIPIVLIVGGIVAIIAGMEIANGKEGAHSKEDGIIRTPKKSAK